jgi:hypothetical protein
MKNHFSPTLSVISALTLSVVLFGCQPIQPPPKVQGIVAEVSSAIDPAFDLVQADIRKEGNVLRFSLTVSGEVGATTPAASGQLAGAAVESYVWPTSLNSSAVGFEADQGILALAVTAHPDFDDTPLYDESNDGDKANDGLLWHSHWVVLVPDDACGAGALKVKDIGENETPALPATWPELPLLIDSPDFAPALTDKTISVQIPIDVLNGTTSFNFDGVTAGLRVNADLHAPLLCVTSVYDVASGDLSLPGKVE